VRYGSQKAIVAIESLALFRSRLSPRALGMVMGLAVSHRRERREDWTLAERYAPLKAIPPLE